MILYLFIIMKPVLYDLKKQNKNKKKKKDKIGSVWWTWESTAAARVRCRVKQKFSFRFQSCKEEPSWPSLTNLFDDIFCSSRNSAEEATL